MYVFMPVALCPSFFCTKFEGKLKEEYREFNLLAIALITV